MIKYSLLYSFVYSESNTSPKHHNTLAPHIFSFVYSESNTSPKPLL